MEDRGILADTSILIDFLRKKNKEKTILWKLKKKYDKLFISSVSVFELYAGAKDKQKITDVQALLKWLSVIEFDEEIGEMAGKIYIVLKQQNKTVDYRDLFIGTTAIFFDLEIATLNISHFETLPKIKILHSTRID